MQTHPLNSIKAKFNAEEQFYMTNDSVWSDLEDLIIF
jgi:hypothetical protein